MDRKQYYWIVARDPDTNKPYLIFGSDRDEASARQKGLEMLGGLDFEIKCYPTKDLGSASAYFRGKRLEHGAGLKASTQRIGHDRSLRQRQKRQEAGSRAHAQKKRNGRSATV